MHNSRSILLLLILILVISPLISWAALLEGLLSLSSSRQVVPKFDTQNALYLQDISLEYGPRSALFNELQSAARQWGSSVHMNGFSIYPAVVSPGTVFYHGRPDNDLPKSPEWLAFEMEQAAFFARRNFGMPERPSRDNNDSILWELEPEAGNFQIPEHPRLRVQVDASLDLTRPRSEEGYIHTFRTTRELRLLYFNGMSAAVSGNGTQDLQDIMIDRPIYQNASFDRRGRSPSSTARKLCQWQAEARYNLDGFLRMEANFEIIMCDFKSDALELLHTNYKRFTIPDEDNQSKKVAAWRAFQFLRAASQNYFDIQGGRVKLDYKNMISVYSMNEAESLLDYTQQRLRLTKLTKKNMEILREQVDAVFRHDLIDQCGAINWRDWTDPIVSRYSNKIASLKVYSETEQSRNAFDALVFSAMSNYVDASTQNVTAQREKALEFCIYELLPPFLTSPREQKLFQALEAVTKSICITFLHFYYADHSIPLSEHRKVLDQLSANLRWSTWKQCRGCRPEELCMIPMFPFGSQSDYDAPNCIVADDIHRKEHLGFW